MSDTYKQVSDQRHNRDAENRNRQRRNPEQKHSQDLVAEATGRKKQCEEQSRKNPEQRRKGALCESTRNSSQSSCFLLADAPKSGPRTRDTLRKDYRG